MLFYFSADLVVEAFTAVLQYCNYPPLLHVPFYLKSTVSRIKLYIHILVYIKYKIYTLFVFKFFFVTSKKMYDFYFCNSLTIETI